MKLSPKKKEELSNILWNISSTGELNSIAAELGLDTLFEPVLKQARQFQERTSQLISHCSKVRDSQYRIKTLESTLFKMIYCRKSDLNRINDIVGFRAIVDNVSDCYRLLAELIEEGLQPSYRFHDSLDNPNSAYRSLDVNFTTRDHYYFQVQIRTPEIQKVYDQGPLTPKTYKEKRFKKLHKYLNDRNFGIEYRLNLFEIIVDNFKRGYNETPKGISGLTTVIDLYSAGEIDYSQLYEIRLTENSREILKS